MQKFGLHIALVFILLFLGGCKKDFDELNTDPNNPVETNPDFLFTEAVAIGCGEFNTGVHTEIWSLMEWSMMMGNMAGYTDGGDPYAYSSDWNNELWAFWYQRVLSPCQQIIRLTENDPFLVNKQAMARIWKVYAFQRLTDLYGSIPYSEALQGWSPDGPRNLAPAYDNQKSIYLDMINELEEAVDQMDANAGSYGSADPLYQGDVTLWTKFANSLRLRLALRISNAEAGIAQQEVSDILSNESMLISSNNEGAHFPFLPGTYHHFVDLARTGQGMRNPSHFLIEMLQSTNDPRIEVFAERTPQFQAMGIREYSGVPNLQTASQLADTNQFNSSAVGQFFLNDNLEGTTMSFAEVCFLKAEAALKGWGGSNSAKGYFDEGVRADMEWMNLPDSSITNYLNGPGQFDGTLEHIISQKWLSLVYRNGYEAFAEIRRTGFPVLKTSDGNPIDMSNLPQRLPYPNSEITLNGNHVAEVGEGINDRTTKLWWAQ